MSSTILPPTAAPTGISPVERAVHNSPTLIDDVRDYWSTHIHDASLSDSAPGKPAFFRDLSAYRYGKLTYLLPLLSELNVAGAELLEIGCGIGLDLAHFARAGASVHGVELSTVAVDLARKHLEHQGLRGTVEQMNGEALALPDACFDFVHAHGVLPYTPEPQKMIHESYRVLRPGGQALFMFYNRNSWLTGMSRLTGVAVEHVNAPVLQLFSIAQVRALLSEFAEVTLRLERFPVATKLHSGWRAALYNGLFVGGFNALPQRLVSPLGWHIVAIARK